MRSVALFLAAASTTDAFNAPRNQALHLTSLSAVSVDTHHRLAEQELGVWQTVSRDSPASNEVVNGEEKRASWTSYAPEHGTPMSYGAVGCPGGGDWCYASPGAAVAATQSSVMKSRAASIAAALAGLGKGVGGATSGVGTHVIAFKPPSSSPQSEAQQVLTLLPSSEESEPSPAPTVEVAAPASSYESQSAAANTKDYLNAMGGGTSSGSPAKSYGIGAWKKASSGGVPSGGGAKKNYGIGGGASWKTSGAAAGTGVGGFMVAASMETTSYSAPEPAAISEPDAPAESHYQEIKEMGKAFEDGPVTTPPAPVTMSSSPTTTTTTTTTTTPSVAAPGSGGPLKKSYAIGSASWKSGGAASSGPAKKYGLGSWKK